MAKILYVTIATDPATKERLGQIAESQRRSIGKQLEVLVYREWVKMFGNMPGKDVVEVDELPGPGDHRAVPVVYVQEIRE